MKNKKIVVALFCHELCTPILHQDLPQMGRWDLVCRCICSSFFLSHGIRYNVTFRCYSQAMEKTLTINGEEVKHLEPNEKNTAILLGKAFSENSANEKCLKGFSVVQGNTLIDRDLDNNLVVLLDEEGDEEIDIEGFSRITLLMGDQTDIMRDEMDLKDFTVRKWSLGKQKLLSSQCITIALYLLDKKVSCEHQGNKWIF